MCVRYMLHKTDAALAVVAQALARKFAAPDWLQPRYNVAPTQVMPVVAGDGDDPRMRGMRWGYVPAGERDRTQRRMLTNAKAETATILPAFRGAAKHRRCLIPANGFYEWKAAGRLKLPYLFMLKDEEPFAFAGLWEPGTDTLPETFAILTTAPNEVVQPIHHRMPVILTAAMMARWLGGQPLPENEFRDLTRPLPAEWMNVRPVSRFVSNSRNEGPQCLAPPDEALLEPELPLG